MWNLLIVDPMVNALLWLYGLLGNNYFLAIVVLTVLIRLIVWPLTFKQQQSSAAMQELQPQMAKLREKYKDDPQKQQQEIMALYKEAGVSPLGGCLPTIIQFPLLIGMYQALRFTLAGAPLELIQLSQRLYLDIPAILPNPAELIPINSQIAWLDLSQPDPLYILTVFVVITTFLQQKLITPPPTDPNTAGMTRSMQLMMLFLPGFYSAILPSGLSVYWIVSNIIGVVQYSMMGKASIKNLLGTADGSPFTIQGFLGLPEASPATSSTAGGSGRRAAASERAAAAERRRSSARKKRR